MMNMITGTSRGRRFMRSYSSVAGQPVPPKSVGNRVAHLGENIPQRNAASTAPEKPRAS